MKLKAKIFAVIWVMIIIGMVAYVVHDNWLLNTPQRLTNPTNWIYVVVLIVMYFIGTWGLDKLDK